MEDQDDAVQRDRAALLAEVPGVREVVVGRVARELVGRRDADLRESLSPEPAR